MFSHYHSSPSISKKRETKNKMIFFFGKFTLIFLPLEKKSFRFKKSFRVFEVNVVFEVPHFGEEMMEREKKEGFPSLLFFALLPPFHCPLYIFIDHSSRYPHNKIY